MCKSRAELLEALDRPALKALPNEPYECAELKRAPVAPDFRIEIADHFNSVPSKLIRDAVEARITNATVEIFHKGQRVASDLFSRVRNRHTTMTEHVPSAHRRFAERTPAKMMDEPPPRSARRRSRCLRRSYAPGINRTYQDLANYYSCGGGRRVSSNRATRPKSKSPVQIVKRFVLAKLRNTTFFSLAELIARRLGDACFKIVRHQRQRHAAKRVEGVDVSSRSNESQAASGTGLPVVPRDHQSCEKPWTVTRPSGVPSWQRRRLNRLGRVDPEARD